MLSPALILVLPQIIHTDFNHTQLPWPNVIDEWLAGHKIDMDNEVIHSGHLNLPSLDSLDAGRGTRLLDWTQIKPHWMEGGSRSISVSCVLQLKVVPFIDHHNEECFEFSLYLYAQVPITSHISVAHLSSPAVILGRYEGLTCDHSAPHWTRLLPTTAYEIRQPCYMITEIFHQLANWPENSDPQRQSAMHAWTAAMKTCIINSTGPRRGARVRRTAKKFTACR
ncbi:hypothetical protein FIBSPDRAFT_901223 [Athelia psychrophila]|uniref:Uncharacterized protein n=1 Tax=Athelia psychrophila TaxID=1759441 RepID=A0A165XFI3_9AGAM|nr:hypothetical protein FIBSPDRAFT_901223 [Fibularhizoctonia sp. CBS 109695]